ncbi:MAG TPA: DUF47 family protein [Actinomycetota bacterium]|nr:DUF47 family protein [Actinomycetota bacterium]
MSGSWWERLLRAATPDVLGLLVVQSRVSVEAVDALAEWSQGGDEEAARRVGDLEHRADDARRALVDGLQGVLASPVNQENLYVISERCDRVVNAAKNLVHQAEALTWAPDGFAAEMADPIQKAMTSVCSGIEHLGHAHEQAARAASEAIKTSRGVEHAYRRAVADLVEGSDLRRALASGEIYRRYADTGLLVAATADRLWFAVLAEG